MSEVARINAQPKWHNPYPQAARDRLSPAAWYLRPTGHGRLRAARREARQAQQLIAATGDSSHRSANSSNAARLARAFLAFGLCPAARQTMDVLTTAAAVSAGALVEAGGKELRVQATMIAALAVASSDPGLHVCVANDQDVEDLSEVLNPAADLLGLRLGCVRAGDSLDIRRDAYAAPLTLVSVEQVAGDYLRDYLRLGQKRSPIALKLDRLRTGAAKTRLCLRGLKRAILTDAGDILLERARQPIILSGPGGAQLPADVIAECLGLAGRLRSEQDFEITKDGITLTQNGVACVARLAHLYPSLSLDTALGRKRLCLALLAIHGMKPNRDYHVEDGRIRPLDVSAAAQSDQVMAARPYLQAHLGLPVTEDEVAVARINLQMLFSRYVSLSGTGLGLRVAQREIHKIYKAPGPLLLLQKKKQPKFTRAFSGAAERADVLQAISGQSTANGRHVYLIAGNQSEAAAIRLHLPEGSTLSWPGGPATAPPSDYDLVLLTPPRPGPVLDRLIEDAPRRGPSQVSVLIDLDGANIPGRWHNLLCKLHKTPLRRLVLRVQARVIPRMMSRQASQVRQDLWNYDQRLSEMLAFAGDPE